MFCHFRRRWDTIDANMAYSCLWCSTLVIIVTRSVLSLESVQQCDGNFGEREKQNIVKVLIIESVAVCALLVIHINSNHPSHPLPKKTIFRKCVPYCGFWGYYALHINCVEPFQGQYKDGSNGTCDFTMFSASFLILRVWILCSYYSWSYIAIKLFLLLKCFL